MRGKEKEILIVEDKIQSALALEKIIKSECTGAKVFIADSLEKALTLSIINKVELMLVDVVLKPEEKNDISGIDFVMQIRQVDRYKFVPIIMVTSLEDPKLFSYEELHCYSFIEKPYDEMRIRKIIRDALEYRGEETEKKFVFKSDGIIYTIDMSEIMYIETVGKKMTVHTQRDEMQIPYIPIIKMIERLPAEFVQCSRNCIVNSNYVEKIDLVNRIMQMKNNNIELEIGIRMKKNIAGLIKNDR